jgi:L-2,4-diaminobutyric acid acetyltransferase
MPVMGLQRSNTLGHEVSAQLIAIRVPRTEDGAHVAALVAQCAPLDLNSTYCYLLQCTQFADTCAIAEMNGAIVGFISGHRVPDSPDSLFIWQVAVAEEARGRGLGRDMMLDILRRPSSKGFTQLLATATDDNLPSRRMFQSLADSLQTRIGHSIMFDRDIHFAGAHESEVLLTIGPFRAMNEKGRVAI